WLKQLDHGSIGHGVSLLCWRSGGANTPTIRHLPPVTPSPTSAYTSSAELKTLRTLRAALVTPESELREILSEIHRSSPSRMARDLAGTLKGLVDETFSGI